MGMMLIRRRRRASRRTHIEDSGFDGIWETQRNIDDAESMLKALPSPSSLDDNRDGSKSS
jgi:hypothetical protein